MRTFASDAIPAEPDALLVLGGGMSAWQPLPHLREELRLIRRCLDAQRPVLGICLGSQLLSMALGGSVARAPRKEIGFHPVKADRTLFGEDEFTAFHWHGDAFTLPAGAEPVASSETTPLQAFRLGSRALGIQFHIEVDEDVLGAMIVSGAQDLEEVGLEPESLRAQAMCEVPRLREIASRVFRAWSG